MNCILTMMFVPLGSDLIYVETMGQPILVLNSLHAVTDIMERRASNYSDRKMPPALAMWAILPCCHCPMLIYRCRLEKGLGLTVMNYGLRWKANRRAFHQYYNRNEVSNYHPIMEQQTMTFLKRLAVNPRNFVEDTK